MKNRLLVAPLLFGLVAVLAACGGGSPVPASAVAMVGSVPVSTADFHTYFDQAVATAIQNGGQAPKPGTQAYTDMRDQVVAELVRITEVKQQAKKEHISVTPSEVEKFIADFKKQYFKGSEKKFEAWLKQQSLTLADARKQVIFNLLTTKIHDKVTASASVSDAQVRSYYTINLSQYTTPAISTRNVAHILVNTKSKAEMIEQKLRNGADFADLAMKDSIDRTSAIDGGKLCIAKPQTSGKCSQTVAPFEKAAFALPVGQISPPVQSQYGWHVIKALSPVKATPAHTTPFKEAKDAIKQNLLKTQQDQLFAQWTSALVKEYEGKVSYQSGYAPPPTTALTDTSATLSTG